MSEGQRLRGSHSKKCQSESLNPGLGTSSPVTQAKSLGIILILLISTPSMSFLVVNSVGSTLKICPESICFSPPPLLALQSKPTSLNHGFASPLAGFPAAAAAPKDLYWHSSESSLDITCRIISLLRSKPLQWPHPTLVAYRILQDLVPRYRSPPKSPPFSFPSSHTGCSMLFLKHAKTYLFQGL